MTFPSLSRVEKLRKDLEPIITANGSTARSASCPVFSKPSRARPPARDAPGTSTCLPFDSMTETKSKSDLDSGRPQVSQKASPHLQAKEVVKKRGAASTPLPRSVDS